MAINDVIETGVYEVTTDGEEHVMDMVLRQIGVTGTQFVDQAGNVYLRNGGDVRQSINGKEHGPVLRVKDEDGASYGFTPNEDLKELRSFYTMNSDLIREGVQELKEYIANRNSEN